MRKIYLMLLAVCFAAAVNGQVDVAASGGTPNASYTTLKAAFDAINAGTHTGIIVISITGNTTETASAVLNASGSGSASYTNVTISPAGGASRTITGAIAAGSPLIDFNGADNVTVDGLNTGGNSLTISNTTASGTSGTSTIRFIGGATSNTITNCSVQGSFSASVGTNGGNIFFSTDALTANGNDNNTISNCNIGPAGTNLPTKGIYGNGSTTTTAIGNSGNIIDNNNIFDFFGAGVTSAGIYTAGGCNTWSITNNRFYQTGTRTWTTGAQHSGIWIIPSTATSGAQAFTITGNTIGYASNTQTGTYTLTGSTGKFVGIFFTGITGGTVSNINNNTIASVSLTGVTSSGTSTSSPFAGMIVTNGLANTNSNTIGSQGATGSMTFSTNTTTSTDVYGIFNFSVDDWTANSNNIGGISVTNAGASGTFVVYGLRANTSTSKIFNATSNNIGGTVSNSIQLNATGASSQVVGMHSSNAACSFTSNNIRNLTSNIGTGTTTGASVIGVNLTTTSVNHTVSQNTIHTLTNTNASAATTITGIQYTSSTGTNLISRNFIHSFSAASATAIMNGIQVSGGTSTYQNNMIRLGVDASGSSIATGLSINGINELGGTNNIYHNSVYLGGTGVGGTVNSFAFRNTVTTGARVVRDNIFFNARSNGAGTGKHYSVTVAGTAPNPAGLTINNNLYYVNGTGSVFGFFNSLDVANLAAWQTAVGQDANSFFGDPQFIAPNGTSSTLNLHIHATNPTLVEGNGADVGVTDDFDAEVRATLTPVDIGADAGDFTAASNMTYVSSTTTQTNTSNVFTNTTNQQVIGIEIVTTGSANPLSVTDFTLNTNGTTNVADIANAKLWYTGTSSSFGTTAQFGSTFAAPNGSFNISGTQALAEGTNYFWLTYDVPCGATAGNVIDAEANSITVGSPQTPTVQAPAGSRTIVTGPLSGTYTIGSGGNYATLTAAVADVNTKGLGGNTVFSILNSITEAGMVTINQWSECGGSNFTLTIKPAASTSPTISANSTTAVIKLNGADRVTIDGSNSGGSSKNLTITNTNTNTSGNAVIWIASASASDGATNNTIKNCIITGNSETTTLMGIFSGGTATISTTGSALINNASNTIQNNTISKSQNGIFVRDVAAATLGTGLQIIQNTIGTTAAGDGFSLTGIVVHFQDGAIISNNEIQNQTTTSTSNSGGIILLDTKNGTVNANNIHNLRYTGTSTGKIVGIHTSSSTYNVVGNPSNITFSNNIVYDLSSTATSTSWNTSGISNNGGYNDKYYFNSVYLTGQMNNTGTGGSACFANGNGLTSTNCPVVDMQNNIFYMKGSANAASTLYAHYTTVTTYSGSTINYNDLLSTATGSATAQLGRFNLTNYADLATWQSATGQEANSISIDPLFNSNTNLQPYIGSPVVGAGVTGTGITTDFLGVTRNDPPTIGAYENAGDFAGPAITYTLLGNTLCTTAPTLSATITDLSGVNTTAGTKPRLYFKKSTDNNNFVGNTSGDNGWKFVEASNSSSPFSFTFDYSLLQSAVTGGDIIQYFVVAQDLAGTPNVGINSGVFAATPASVALTSAAFPITGTINSYTILSGGLSGTVTIGATGTYTTLTGATGSLFAAINAGGLTGNLTAEILDASITETGATALNAINYGCTPPYTLTIKPASGVNTVITGTVATGAVIKLNGADNVTIDGSNNATTSRNLTIINNTTTTSGNAVIWLAAPALGNGSTNNTIKNTIIEGNAATTSFLGMYVGGNTTISLTAAGNDNNSSNTITNNLFRKTQYGLALFGFAAATPDNNNVISNNIFGTATAGEGFNFEGIHADRQNNLVVSGNDVQNVKSTTGTTNLYGIRLLDFKNGQAYNNKVHNLNYSGTSTAKLYGLAVQSSSYTTSGNPSLATIYNNIVYDITSSATSTTVWNLTGMFAGQGYGDKYYFNSIHLTGQLNNSSAGLSAAFANGDGNITTFGTNLDVRNNIFNLAGTSTGGNVWAYYSKATNLTGTTQNYNVLRSAGTGATNNTAQLNAVNYTTLAAWQGASGVDANSIESDPLFNSGTNLQPQPGSPVVGAGQAISGITTDILGVTRGNPPTIGAYETAVDVTGPTITYTLLANTLCTTNPVLSATITDASGVNVTSPRKPRIYYKKTTNANSLGATNDNTTDGWKYTEATNSTSPFSLTIDYALLFGGAPVGGDRIQYFVVAEDLAATPNVSINSGTFAAAPVSVALTGAAFPITGTINEYSIIAGGLSTDVTIGATGTYLNLTGTGGLFAAINSGGLTANITATILDATITETGTNPLNAINYGCGGPFTLTIRPGSGVATVISGSSGTPLIDLNGADNVTINGINSGGSSMIIRNTATNAATIRMIADASNNTIQNSTIEGAVTTATLGVVMLSTGTTTGNDNITISNNTIRDRSDGTGVPANLIYSSGTSSTVTNGTINVSNNTLKNFTGTAILLSGAGSSNGNENWTISGNEIFQEAARTTANTGITFNALGTNNILQNYIHDLNTTGAVSGIVLNDARNTSVSRNRVIQTTVAGSTGTWVGIFFNGSSGNPATATVANNMVSLVPTSSATQTIYGMRDFGFTGNTVNFYFNSVLVGGTATGSATWAFVRGTSSPTVCTVNDNIFFNNRTGGTVNHFAIGDQSLGSGTFTSNYNLLVGTGITAANYFDRGTASGGTAMSFASWQATAGTPDLNSRASNPGGDYSVASLFISPSDLHIQPTNCLPNGAGLSISGITTDFDADTRGTPPDIGADEYNATLVTPSVSIAAAPGSTICAGTSVTFTATPTNGGTTPAYQWKLNGSNVGTNSNTYTNTSLANGDQVQVEMTSNNPCASPTTANSNTITMTVTATVTPSVSIAAAPGSTICAGTSVTFTATPTNGGTTPSYQWKLNGSNVGTNSNTYTNTSLANGDQVQVEMTSNATCASPATVSSNTVTMTVTATVTPSVSIAAAPGSTICAGTSVTFTATPTNGGTTPSYQWKLNGSNVGTNSNTYTNTSLANGDQVQVEMTSNETCASPATVSSNTVTMTVTATVTPSVSIAAAPGSTICAGTSVTFTATPTNGGSTPSYQWKLNGSNVGTNSNTYTNTSLANGDQVQVEMTSNATCASPATVSSNTVTMTVTATVTPSVSIAAAPGSTICSGTSVTFTATPTNGGTTPSYQWKLNGSNVGTNSNTYTNTTLANGDQVQVEMTSNATCASPATVSSNTVTMTVNANVTPSVSIAAAPGSTICTGTSVTFTATPTNGGTTPSYQWKLNGSNVGTNSNTYTNASLANGDQVQVEMTSNATCASPATVSSNTITMTVTTTVTPSVSIAAAPGSTICSGTSVTFTATPTNGGTTPSYQWKLNGGNVGTNSNTYTNTSLANGDQVQVEMTSNNPCASPTTANSNTITMTVNANVTPSVSIAAAPGSTICAGTSVTFTATPTNGGTTPSYQWKLNGSNVGTNSNTYTNTSLANGDQVQVEMTSNATCASPATVSSNTVTMTVNANVTPSVSIAAAPGSTICTGTSVTFTATPTNGGTTPSYQWKLNGSNVGTNSNTYTNTSLANGDQVQVEMTSNATCASPATVSSNTVTMTVNANVTPSVSIAAAPGSTICAGTSVTFTATPTNGGTTPSYQWKLNGSNVGTNSNTYTNTSLANSDQVQVEMTSNATCASPATANSNTITMTVTATVTPSVSIAASPGSTICAGSTVIFTATPTNGGTTPSYQWKLNGSNVGTNSNTYTNSSLVNGNQVQVEMTSNANCASPATANSNTITMTVTALSGTLAGTAGGAQVCKNMDVGTGATYSDPSCNVIAKVVPSGGSPVSGLINSCVKVETTPVQDPATQPYIARHFDITPATNASTATAAVTLYAKQSEFDDYNAFLIANSLAFSPMPTNPGGSTTAIRVRQYHGNFAGPGLFDYTGSNELLVPVSVTWNSTFNWWEITVNANGFSGFFVTTQASTPTPVTLLSFSGYKQGSVNILRWTTSSEQNNVGFEVQRSADGINYSAIGFVNSQAPGGISQSDLHYTFTDNNPASKQFYRLRQVDIDGRSKLSNIVLIKEDQPLTFAIGGLFPNPASSQVHVIVNAPSRNRVTLVMTDIAGRIVLTQKATVETGSNTITVGIGHLAQGSYLVKLVCDNGCDATVNKFIKE